MKIILLVLLLFSSLALSEEASRDLIKSDLDLVYKILDVDRVKKVARKKLSSSKLEAVSVLLKDLESRIHREFNDCSIINRFKKTIKAYIQLSGDNKLELQDYYGDGTCRSYPTYSCVNRFIDEHGKLKSVGVNKSEKYYSIELCLDYINENQRYQVVEMSRLSSEKIGGVLSDEYMSFTSLEGKSLRVDNLAGKLVYKIKYEISSNTEKSIQYLSEVIQLLNEFDGSDFSYKLSVEEVRGQKFFEIVDLDVELLKSSVPCGLGLSLEEWNLLPVPARQRKTIRCIIESKRGLLSDQYNELLTKDPSLSGKLTLRFRIQPDGKVSAESIRSDFPEVFSNYAIALMERLEFPQVSYKPFDVEYTFTFKR